MPFSHSGTSRTFPCTTRTLQCFTSKLGHRGHVPTSAAKITKQSAVNHKEIDTNGVNRMLLRRPWRTDLKNRFLDKVWTPQFSTTPPKPFLLSFSTHLGDQTLARSIWKRSQLLDAFLRLAQGLTLWPYERGSVSTVVCHLFVVRVLKRSAVCSKAFCVVSGEVSVNFERPSRSHFSLDSRQKVILV